MARVFISWASPDRAVVDEVAKRLEADGLSFFISLRDMQAGDEAVKRVRQEVAAADVGILLLSDLAVEREWIVREIEWLVYAEKPIITASVGPLSADKVPPIIRNLHRIDLAPGPKQDERFEDLRSAV